MTNFKTPNFIDLTAVRELIKEALQSDSSLLNEVVSYSAAGKQLRPMLALLSYSCFNKKETISNEMYKTAAALELLHMASLLHDDVIDRSQLRRHKPSTYAKYGLTASLLAGDFLYIRAFGLCATLNKGLISEVEQTCIALTEGEIEEKPLSAASYSIDDAIQIATKKTASLFRLACLVGSDLALREINTQNDTLVGKMATFGEKLGIAFQIIDDILDVVSTKEDLGKPIGGDIKERKPSIVNVLWLNSGSAMAAKLLPCEFEIDEQQIESAIGEIKASGIITKAKQLADNYLRDAETTLKDIIEEIGRSDSTDTLQEILYYSKDRKF